MRKLFSILMAALVFMGALVSCAFATAATLLSISDAKFSISIAGIGQVPPLAIILVPGVVGVLGMFLADYLAKDWLK